MRIAGDIFDNPCHFKVAISVKINGFSQGIFMDKNLFSRILGQHDRAGGI